MTRLVLIMAALAGLITTPAMAEPDGPRHAVGATTTYSVDADDTEVLKLGLNLDAHYRSEDDYWGIRLERARFSPQGQEGVTDERVFVRLAKPIGDWQLRAEVGTDGRQPVGSVSVHNEAPWRFEAFVERDRLETPEGVARDLYATFGGAALDIPLGEGRQVTLLGGLQEFDGRNVRTHLRANAIQVVKRDWGLSAQLRTRYFRNSVPGEADYFSPDWYVEVLPVVQVRRFSGGWQYLGAVGYGAQRDTNSDWRSSRYVNLRVISPQGREGWAVRGDLTYTNQPITDSGIYDYLRVSVSVTRAF